jgi:hypothetical protein
MGTVLKMLLPAAGFGQPLLARFDDAGFVVVLMMKTMMCCCSS